MLPNTSVCVPQQTKGAERSAALVNVDDVSMGLYGGVVTALVGESGSGKSTAARVLAQLYSQSAGTIKLHGRPIRAKRGRLFRRYVREVQIIFQDPFSSLNPTRTVRHHLSTPLKIDRRAKRRKEIDATIEGLLREVNLVPPQQFLDKFPHELSGGQRQRVAIARALACRARGATCGRARLDARRLDPARCAQPAARPARNGCGSRSSTSRTTSPPRDTSPLPPW